jgi:O-acetyl-ADP-ribose deacetylase (regulator of RNase III)
MINYLKGDVTKMEAGLTENAKVLIHVCNNHGGFGAGVSGAIGGKWPIVENVYRYFSDKLELGTIQFVRVEDNKYVCNLIAQDGYSTPTKPACDLKALKLSLKMLNQILYLDPKIEIHGPRLGAGLGGRSWSDIEPILQEVFPDKEVYIYDLP